VEAGEGHTGRCIKKTQAGETRVPELKRQRTKKSCLSGLGLWRTFVSQGPAKCRMHEIHDRLQRPLLALRLRENTESLAGTANDSEPLAGGPLRRDSPPPPCGEIP